MAQKERSQHVTTMIHHVKEIQLRLLVVVAVLVVGMIIGYLFYEQLFQFIKSPLHTDLHYTSPAGSFNFIIKICLMVGLVAALPVAVYNIIMFIQPALQERITKLRVYVTTFLSLFLALAGASFAFLVIIPMALAFFFKFQVDGLQALISADDYLQFVVNVIVTFALIFQLPLVISFIDHVKPLPPKKLFKAEKFIIVGSIAIGVLVPFALDPAVQFLIASPIIILYNLSIVVVLVQRHARRRRAASHSTSRPETLVATESAPTPVVTRNNILTPQGSAVKHHQPVRPAVISDIGRSRPHATPTARPPRRMPVRQRGTSGPRLISDMRPARPPVQRALSDT